MSLNFLVTQELKRGINMPYAIFSKRTRIINRIVNDLTSLLPSESMIEVDDEINYPRLTKSLIQGQNINTLGWPLFVEDGYSVVMPTYVDRVTDVDGRPFTVKNRPVFVQPQFPGGGGQKTMFVDINFISHPFGWTAEELAQVKYQSVLSQNHPFEVVIGEEWIDNAHIDVGSSSGFFLSEGQLWLAPAAELITKYFSFRVDSNLDVAVANANNVGQNTYIFDTYFLNISPDIPTGVKVDWSGVAFGSGDPGTDPGWNPAKIDEETPTTNVGDTIATPLRSIRLRFRNRTSSVLSLENYVLFLRSRNYRLK
jgi:hypothetical protein